MPRVELPPLNAQQKELSDRFVARIKTQIQRHGAIPFSEFMQRSLYEDGFGYYVNGFSKLGKHGDFTTAPEMSDDFAYCLARQCQQVVSVMDDADILEFGGGSGKLALDLLQSLQKIDCLPDRYLILDVSVELQQEQRARLKQHLPPDIYHRVEWLQALPDKFNGVLIANEVLDAFAVERFTIQNGQPYRLMVDWDESGFTLLPCVDDLVHKEVLNIQKDVGAEFDNGFTSEYCALLLPWWQSVSDCLERGAVLVCDYGADRQQYYAPKNSNGTLRCFFRHTLHDDPFLNPAVQDITADVDFTAVAIAATAAGFDLQGYSPLSEFMLSLDLLDHHQNKVESMDTRDRLSATGDLKRIIMPQEMGDRFMVIGFSKGIESALDGFSRADLSRLL